MFLVDKSTKGSESTMVHSRNYLSVLPKQDGLIPAPTHALSFFDLQSCILPFVDEEAGEQGVYLSMPDFVRGASTSSASGIWHPCVAPFRQ